MSVTAPPRPPRPDRSKEPLNREEIEALVEALIEEVRQETRRRRRKYWAIAALVTFVGVVLLTVLDRGAASQTASPALSARSSVAGAASSKIAFITGFRSYCTDPPACTARPPRGSDAAKGLYIVNADGSGLRLVAQNASPGAAPAWSPDGGRLAFNGTSDGRGPNRGIYLVNADGSGLQHLTNGGSAAWSPDGQKIAFDRGGAFPPHWRPSDGAPDSDIYVMNADGSGTKNLTRSPKPDGGAAWSPDGQKIAFQRVVGVIPCGTGGCGRAESDIYVMNADGSRQRNLTREPTLQLGSPTWSPDGQKIIFQRRAKGKNWEIFAINADGSGERNLTRNPSHDIDADWSPDGRRIVFRTSRHGKWELYLMNADGSGQRRLTRTAVNESRPSWSPDGQKIAFTREAGHNFELYVMNADGSGQRRLTPNSPWIRWVAFAWSPAQ